MPKKVQSYILKPSVGVERQTIGMPRRARILFVTTYQKLVRLFCEVEFDESTAAFEVPHKRHFILIGEGGVVPEGAGYIGGDAESVVYEVRG